MIEWKNIKTEMEKINDPIDLETYLNGIVYQILKIIFKPYHIQQESLKIAGFRFDVSFKSKKLNLLCEIKYGSKSLISYYKSILPKINQQIKKMQRKKRTVHLVVYIGQIDEYYKSELSSVFSNIYGHSLIIELRNLIKISNYYEKHPNMGLLLFENIIEFSSGFLDEKFINTLLDFINRRHDYFNISKEVSSLLSYADRSILTITRRRLIKRYKISDYDKEILLIVNKIIIQKLISRDQIIDIVDYPHDYIDLIIQYLTEEKKILLIIDIENYGLNDSFDSFIQLFNLIYQSNDHNSIIKLFTSDYLANSIENHHNLIFAKFNLNELDLKQEEEFCKIFSLFPNVLDFCLNEEKELELYEGATSYQDFLYASFKMKIFEKLIIGYFSNNKLIHRIFADKKIFHERIIGNIILLQENKQYLDFNIESEISQVKLNLKEPLKKGTPISFKKPEATISIIANFIELKNFDKAISLSEKYLKDMTFDHIRDSLLINQGVAYAYQGKFSKAIDNYISALKIAERPIIYKNLVHAWFNKYIQAVEDQKEYPLIAEFLLDYLHKSKVNLNKLKLLDISKDKNVNSEDITELEYKIQGEFENFYKQYLKNVDENQIPRALLILRNYDLSYLKEIYNHNKSLIEKLYIKEFYELGSSSWNALAVTCLLLEKNDVALDLVNKAFKSLDEKINGIAYLDTKAEILMNLGRDVEALKYFLEILEIDENNYKVKDFYAETCWKTAILYQKLGDSENYQIYRKKTISLLETHCKDDFIKKKIKNDLEV